MEGMNSHSHTDRVEGKSHGPIGDFGASAIVAILVSTAISAAATGISMLLAGRQKNPTSPFDSRATPLSQRGVTIPNLYGRRRLSFTFAWAGDRKSTSHKGVRTYFESAWHVVCVGPCDALHAIYEDGKPIFTKKLTPADTPSGSKVTVDKHGDFYIYWGQCDQAANPRLSRKGTNKDGQPAYPGVRSRWPGVCYIEWVRKNLGYAPQWKRLEYEFERRGASNTTTLDAAPNWIAATTEPNRVANTTVWTPTAKPAGTYTVTYTGGACRWGSDFNWSVQAPGSTKYGFWIVNAKGTPVKLLPGNNKQFNSAAAAAADNAGKHLTFKHTGGVIGVRMSDAIYADNVAGAPNPTWEFQKSGDDAFSIEGVVQQNVSLYGSADDGMNPVHAIWQILTGPHPYGMALPVDCLDADSFNECAAALATERLPVNFGGDPTVDGRTNLADVMVDAGVMLAQAGDKLRLVLIRPNAAARALIPADAYADAKPSTTRVHSDLLADRTSFYIKDRVRNYKANDHIGAGDHDALALINGRPRSVQIELKTITDVKTGANVAGRRALDVTADKNRIEFKALRNADDLYAGQPISVEGVGDFIVQSVTPGVVSGGTKIKAVVDQYGRGADDSAAVDSYQEGFGFDGPDAYVDVVQTPLALSPSSTLKYVTPLRIREDIDVFDADVLISADDANYTTIGSVPFCTGGTLNSPVDAAQDFTDSEGPTITVAGPDFADLVVDLTGRDREYDAGLQLGYCGGEWFFVRKVTAVSGGFRLDGLTRARFGTAAVDHDANAPFFIVRREAVATFNHPVMTVGDTVFVKVQPNDVSGYPAIEPDAIQPIAVEVA